MAWEPDYITDAELRHEIKDDDATAADLARWKTAGARAVDGWCHRQFGQVATVEVREYETVYDRRRCVWTAPIDDLQDLTGLIVVAGDETLVVATSTVSGYRLFPRNNADKGRPFEWIEVPRCGLLTITALWGWTAVPNPVKLANMMQSHRFASRRDSVYGVAGSPSEGSEVRLLARLDPDVQVILGKRYRRERWVA